MITSSDSSVASHTHSSAGTAAVCLPCSPTPVICSYGRKTFSPRGRQRSCVSDASQNNRSGDASEYSLVCPHWHSSHPMTVIRLVPHLPLCCFGPGGSYIVDWQVKKMDLRDPHARLSAHMFWGSLLWRIFGGLLGDMKLWLLTSHPRRAFRADACPAALDPCKACGHEAFWPHWFVSGQQPPQIRANPDRRRPRRRSRRTANRRTGRIPSRGSSGDLSFPLLATFKPVLLRFRSRYQFSQSPAGRLIARLTAESRNPAESPGLFAPAQARADAPLVEEAPTSSISAQTMEASHDPNPQAAQNPHRDPRLSHSQRLLADDAGTGRSARRLKSNHLRAHRGPGKEGPHSPCPEQGSLFGGLADGAAA